MARGSSQKRLIENVYDFRFSITRSLLWPLNSLFENLSFLFPFFLLLHLGKCTWKFISLHTIKRWWTIFVYTIVGMCNLRIFSLRLIECQSGKHLVGKKRCWMCLKIKEFQDSHKIVKLFFSFSHGFVVGVILENTWRTVRFFWIDNILCVPSRVS